MSQSEYTAQFPVVEVQQTFYQPPKVETLRRWREDAPPDFEFTLKAWMLITHEARSPVYRRLKRELTETEREGVGGFRASKIVREAWKTTLSCIEALDARRVLFQCPASFTPVAPNIKRLRRFFTSIERPDKLQLLWEPRGDWPREVTSALCRELELVHVVDPFVARTTTPEFCYFRLHGRRGFRYVYEEDELEELYEMLPHGQTSYVFFNNVRMREDAARFQELVKRRIAEEEE